MIFRRDPYANGGYGQDPGYSQAAYSTGAGAAAYSTGYGAAAHGAAAADMYSRRSPGPMGAAGAQRGAYGPPPARGAGPPPPAGAPPSAYYSGGAPPPTASAPAGSNSAGYGQMGY